jgi:hypothetical protein
MTGALPASWRPLLSRRWPAVPRLLVGAGLGWVIGAQLVTTAGPDWRVAAAAAAMAVVTLGAPQTAQAGALGGAPAWALASTIGLYLGVPETGHVLGLGAGLGVLVVAHLAARARSDGLEVTLLGGVLTWAMLQGSVEREPALVGALGTFGLLVSWPVVRRLPGPHRGLAPASLRPLLLTTAHAITVWMVGRRGALENSMTAVAVVAVAGNAGLVLVARLVTGGRDR